MSLWDKLQAEIDKAGTAAKGALDEGKLRIELFRVRQQADKAAQALGYAVHRAKRDNVELAAETFAHLNSTLEKLETEAKQLEEDLAKVLQRDGAKTGDAPAP